MTAPTYEYVRCEVCGRYVAARANGAPSEHYDMASYSLETCPGSPQPEPLPDLPGSLAPPWAADLEARLTAQLDALRALITPAPAPAAAGPDGVASDGATDPTQGTTDNPGPGAGT